MKVNGQHSSELTRRRLEINGVLACVCLACDRAVLFVESKMGFLRCPHCYGPTLHQWGRVKLTFEPEAE